MAKYKTSEQTMRELTLEVARVAQLEAERCNACVGSGYKHDKDCKWLANKLMGCTCYYFSRMPIKRESCTSCSTLRELAKLKYHKIAYTKEGKACGCECGEWANPTKKINHSLTHSIQSIKALLVRLGHWERFKHEQTFDIRTGKDCYYEPNENGWVSTNKLCETLTTDSLMLEAAISYIKGVK